MIEVSYHPLVTVEAADNLAEFVDVITAGLDKIDVPLDELVSSHLTVRVVASIAKPAWAEGKWRQADRLALVRAMRRSDGKPRYNKVQYTAIHEIGHAVDDDRLAGKRADVMALMTPQPSKWNDDDNLADPMARYWRLPSEVFANRLVEAITGGQVRSPYDDDYTRWIPDRKLDELVSIVRRQAPPIVEPIPEPPAEPPPVSSFDEAIVRAAIAETDKAIRAELDDLAALLNG